MALRHFTLQQMVSFSRNWIDPAKERPIIERYAISRAVIPRIEEAHGNLLTFQRKSLASQAEIAAIQKEQAQLDAVHDRNVRGVHHLLTSLAELSADEERAKHYLRLRDLLLPDGLQAIVRSYAAQGGEVLLLQKRLTPEAIASLRRIPTPEGNLHDHVEAWMKSGLALLELDRRRTDIAKTYDDADTTQAEVARARNEWIRAANALRSCLELDRAAPEDVERVFRYVDEASAKADRRAVLPPSSPDEAVDGESVGPEPAPAPPPPCAGDGGGSPETS